MSSPVRHYAGGRFDASGAMFPLIDPVYGRPPSAYSVQTEEPADSQAQNHPSSRAEHIDGKARVEAVYSA